MKKTIYLNVYAFMFTAVCLLMATGLFAQVTGTVTDESNGEPLIGASVFVKGSNTGTITDIDGRYSITATAEDVLVFSFVGFNDLEETVGNRTVVDVILSQGAILEEVVVTGYGSQSKRNLSGAITVVETDQIGKQPVHNVTQALQGRAAGVTVSSDGRPGGAVQLRIRGVSTINNNEPLYVVDGAPVDEFTMQDLNPNDIASVQVLKDASAASIYGVRAANGVVIIETKKGSVTGDSKIQLDMYYGSQIPGAGPDLLNPQQLAETIWEFQRNGGITPSHPQYGTGSTPSLPTYILPAGASTADESTYDFETNGITRANLAGTDWYDEVFNPAPVLNINLSASGGSDQGQYALSAGIHRQDGVVLHTGYDRYSLRANSLMRALDGKLRFGENLQVTYAEEQSGSLGGGNSQSPNNTLAFVYRMPQIIPVFDVGGNFAGSRAGGFNNADSPVAQLTRNKDNIGKFMRVLGTAYIELDIIDGLTLKSSFNANYGLTVENKSYSIRNIESSEPAANATLNQRVDNSSTFTWYNTATYSTSFNDVHNLTVLAGTEAIENDYTPFGAGRVNYFSDNIPFRHLNTGADGITNFGFRSRSSIFSIFGKVDYDYQGKYILSATIRRDGSSRFAEGNRFGVFPSVSAAWRISDEAFFDDIAFFDDLKIRAGWGQVGNQNIPLNTYLDLFSTDLGQAGYAIGGGNNSAATGIQSSQFGNQDVSWETTTQLNIGFDASILDNRLDIAFDWYNRDTEDMLLGVPRPSLSGVAGDPQVNVGTMNNTGIDLGLNYSDQINQDVSLDLGVTFSMYDNEVVALNDPDQFLQDGNFRDQYFASRTAAGQPIGAFFGYDIIGIFQTQAEADAHATQPVNAPGRWKYNDTNNDGVINASDRVFLGSPHPDFSYGINAVLNVKDLDFGLFLQGVQGNEVWNGNKLFTDFFNYFTNSQKGAATLQAWGYNGVTEEAVVPQLNQNAPNIEWEPSSYYLEDGSYMRVKTLTLGYTLGDDVLDRIGFDRLRIYIQGNNLFTISNYSGLDPEITIDDDGGNVDLSPGVDRGNYPVVKSITFGVNATF